MESIGIYEDLKNKIIWLELEPGCTLNLVELARSYGVSRNPMNIALARLDVEELVVRNGSHYVVSPLTVDRIRDITEVRSILEVQAAIWAMQRFSNEGFAKMAEFQKEVQALPPNVENRRIIGLDMTFHHIIYRETKNQSLEGMLKGMLNHYLRFWLSRPTPISGENFFKEHSEIISAFRDKDETRLRAACTGHIKTSLDEIVGL
jgi:DNA-binding GntR family transcriptional regulator